MPVEVFVISEACDEVADVPDDFELAEPIINTPETFRKHHSHWSRRPVSLYKGRIFIFILGIRIWLFIQWKVFCF